MSGYGSPPKKMTNTNKMHILYNLTQGFLNKKMILGLYNEMKNLENSPPPHFILVLKNPRNGTLHYNNLMES